MPRPLALMTAAAALAATPLAALAQGWPAASATGTTKLAAGGDGVATATARVAAWSRTHRALIGRDHVVLRPQPDAADVRQTPDVDVRPRAEWLEDERFDVSPTRVAYRQRF